MPHESHFRVEIVSSCFKDKPRLLRHRIVYQALESVFLQGVHALAISAYTPEEYGLALYGKGTTSEFRQTD